LTLLQYGYNDCNCHQEEKPFKTSRFLLLVSAFWGNVIFAVYTGDLTARMSTPPSSAAPKTFQGLLANEYIILASAFTSGHSFLSSAPKGSDTALAYKVIETNGWLLPEQGTVPIKTLMTQPKTVYFGSVDHRADSPVKEVRGFQSASPVTSAFALQQNSELTPAIDYGIRKMKESGIMAKILNT